jgi:V4R domain
MTPTPSTKIPQIHGEIVVSRFEYLKRLRGAEAIKGVLDSLPPADRSAFRGFDREAWFPFASLLRLDQAIADYAGKPQDEVLEQLGEISAEARTTWLGDHAALVSVHGFLSRTAENHDRFHSFGKASYVRISFSEGELQMSGYPEPSAIYCRSAIGYLRAALTRLTGAPATVTERACQASGAPRCEFRMRWAPSPEAAS